MNIKYKLKKDARQFFDIGFQRSNKEADWWAKQGIHPNLLEEVKNVYIDYGISKTENHTSLSEWQSEGDIAKFYFTIVASDISHKQYNIVSIPTMMDKIQTVIDDFFKQR